MSAQSIGRMACNREPIFDFPNRRQDSLSERPSEHSLEIEIQFVCELSEPSFDGSAREKQLRPFDGIAQTRAYFVFKLTHDAFRIDCHPAAIRVKQHVVVLEITVEQSRRPLRSAELREQVVTSLDQFQRNLIVTSRHIAVEPSAPILNCLECF